jgi:coenzyme Q-binding protein COQ10
MRLSKTGYFADFVVYPPVGDAHHRDAAPSLIPNLVGIGLCLPGWHRGLELSGVRHPSFRFPRGAILCRHAQDASRRPQRIRRYTHLGEPRNDLLRRAPALVVGNRLALEKPSISAARDGAPHKLVNIWPFGLSKMTVVDVAKRMGHPWLDLFNLVLDVKSYPSFVPHCRDVRLLSCKLESPTRTIIVSRMIVGFSALEVGYANRTIGDVATRRIDIEAIDGPFRYLKAAWSFDPEDDHRSKVRFSVDYEFRSQVLSVVASRVFSSMFADIVSAFERRANQLSHSAGPV